MFKPYYEPDEYYSYAKHILFGNFGHAGYINPYAEIMKGYRDYSKNNMLVQFEGEQDFAMITEGLKARVMLNLQRKSEYHVNRNYWPFYYDIQSYNLSNETYKLRRLNPGGGTEYLTYIPHDRQINSAVHLEATLNWVRAFNEKHNVSGLLVYTLNAEKTAITDNLQMSLPKRNLGLAGRFTYDYERRYFVEFNFGYNGSERFHKDHRFGFFPSGVVGWMISNESFFEPWKNVVTDLKIRGSYGLAGQDQIGSANDRFYYLSDVSLASSGGTRYVNWGTNMTYNPGMVIVNRYANRSIGWETSYKTNIGLELALSNGLSTIVEYFHTRMENILIDRVIPNTMGIVPAVKANLGIGKSRGVDVELNYEKSFSGDLWIVARGTYTYSNSEVIEWEEPDYSATPWRSKVGYSTGQQWGYIAERLFVDDEEVRNSPTQFGTYGAGDVKYRDVNGDGRISTLDMVPIGHPTNAPEILYGFGPSVGYKGFDFSLFFQGNARKSFLLSVYGDGYANYDKIAPFLDGNRDDGLVGQNAVIKAFADSYWSETHQNPYAIWPRLSSSRLENNAQPSTWYLHDASFVRLKNAEVGYTLPDHLLKKFHLQNLRVYVSGTNLAYWSRFKWWDPEMAGNGLGYPLQRVINVGVNIGL
jgi:TonB-linked SusC/RagA family outer membrane protein